MSGRRYKKKSFVKRVLTNPALAADCLVLGFISLTIMGLFIGFLSMSPASTAVKTMGGF